MDADLAFCLEQFAKDAEEQALVAPPQDVRDHPTVAKVKAQEARLDGLATLARFAVGAATKAEIRKKVDMMAKETAHKLAEARAYAKESCRQADVAHKMLEAELSFQQKSRHVLATEGRVIDETRPPLDASLPACRRKAYSTWGKRPHSLASVAAASSSPPSAVDAATTSPPQHPRPLERHRSDEAIERQRTEAANRFRRTPHPEADADLRAAIAMGKLAGHTSVTLLRVRPHAAP